MTPVATVYRMYDGEGRLLYIGMSTLPQDRIQKHARKANWWAQVASMTLQHFASRREALDEERAAIEAEAPLLNVRYQLRAPVALAPADTEAAS